MNPSSTYKNSTTKSTMTTYPRRAIHDKELEVSGIVVKPQTRREDFEWGGRRMNRANRPVTSLRRYLGWGDRRGATKRSSGGRRRPSTLQVASTDRLARRTPICRD